MDQLIASGCGHMTQVWTGLHIKQHGSDSKESPAVRETQVRSLGWEDPRRREWQSTPVFLPREFHGQRSLAGYSPWDRRVRHDWGANTCLSFHGTQLASAFLTFLRVRKSPCSSGCCCSMQVQVLLFYARPHDFSVLLGKVIHGAGDRPPSIWDTVHVSVV